MTFGLMIGSGKDKGAFLPQAVKALVIGAALCYDKSKLWLYHRNGVYLELLKRGFSVDVGIVEVAKRNEEGKIVRNYYEVDFIANFKVQRT